MLYLASASPRRQELLKLLGLHFVVAPSRVAERARRGEAPAAMAKRLALAKASQVAGLLRRRGAKSGVVLGADTVVVLSGKPLGKPSSPSAAAAMLRRLSGRGHRVLTGVALLDLALGRRSVFCEATQVFMRRLGVAEIQDYVASGEPLDKAGAYGIQGGAAAFIPKIVGDYFNVVGLPLSRLVQELEKLKK